MITSDEFYFPTQNLENTWSIISSCTVAPVISPNAESASSKSTYRRSKGIPTPFKARSTDSLAFTRESLCLVFDTYTSPLFIVPRANFSAIRSSSFSIPAGVLSFGVEVSTISSVSKPNLFFSSIGVISALLSVLLSITIVVLPFSAFDIFSS